MQVDNLRQTGGRCWLGSMLPQTLASPASHPSHPLPPPPKHQPHLDKVLVLGVPVQQDASAHGGGGVLDVALHQGAQVHQVLG